MTYIEASDIREKSKEDLLQQLDELKAELMSLRVAKVTGGSSSKMHKIHEVKKSIARVLTVIGEQQRHHTREMYLADKQPLPLDLRPKLTKRIRQRMTNKQLSSRTRKEWRTIQRRRLRRYAIMA